MPQPFKFPGVLLFLCVVMTPALALADDLPIVFAEAKKAQFDHSYLVWGKVLSNFVQVDGPRSWVNYQSIRKDPVDLQHYVETLSAGSLDYNNFSKEEKLSFLINAYNALTVTLVVNHNPVSSIKKIGGWLESPWKIQFFKLFGEMHALNDIEHEMLRKKFREPRIHFALNCASLSCPALRNEPYVASKLDAQLNDATQSFLRDPDRNYFDAKTKTLHLSSIFKWYAEDFEQAAGSVKEFVIPYMAENEKQAALIRSNDVTIAYLPYDWGLNE